MDETLKQLIIDAFYHGTKYEKRKGHWITPLDFIEENMKQLKLYKVVGQSEQLKAYNDFVVRKIAEGWSMDDFDEDAINEFLSL